MATAKQRQTLTDLSQPHQMRELNRQLEWIWSQILGGLPIKALSSGAQAIINAKAESEDVEKLAAELVLTTEGLMVKVSRDEIISAINQSAEEILIQANRINLNGVVTANTYFRINEDGSMEAVSGEIGGFSIGKNTLTGKGDNAIILDSDTGELRVGLLSLLSKDSYTPQIRSLVETEPGVYVRVRVIPGLDLYDSESSESLFASFNDTYSYLRSPLSVEGVRVPKIVTGYTTLTGDAATEIDYASAGFTAVPAVIATYSQTGSNTSGDDGVIKIYSKTTTGALAILSGSGGRLVDWIAVGV